MLEDDFTYVFRKSLTGCGLSATAAAKRAEIQECDALSLLHGTFSAETARKLAPVLGLNADAFARHAFYEPEPMAVPGIDRLDLPFGGERVNAWIIRSGGSILLFDAGYLAMDLLDSLNAVCGRLPDRVFITHAHRDHVGGVTSLREAGLPVHAANIPGTIPMNPGDSVFCGPLCITACDLSGHAMPALGFHIEGLSTPVLVTGDALFAGSMGGCSSPAIYQHALVRLRETLAPLTDSTVLLPGHGPATTIGQERGANPFL